jgi:hypothetical protein
MKPSTPTTQQPSVTSRPSAQQQPQQPSLSPKNWAPWSSDPDPPTRRFTPEERERVSQNVQDYYRAHGLPMGNKPASAGSRPQFGSWQDALAGKRK